MKNNFGMSIVHAVRALMFIGCVAIAVSSCKNDPATDGEKPVITMAEPSANDTISIAAASEIHIEFVVTDNDKLQQLSVAVTNAANISLYASNPAVSGLSTYTFHQHFTPSASGVTQLTLTVTATDAHGNAATQTVVFYVRP
jgi:hypothetical protein